MRWRDLDAVRRERLLTRGSDIFAPDLHERIRPVVEDVRVHGDEALERALRQFDRCEVAAHELFVSDEEFAAARAAVPAPLIGALREAIGRVRRFNERLLEGATWSLEMEPGLVVGEQATAIASAGLFVPSGKGSYPSSLVQIATPAIVAGVREIVIAVPPVPGSAGAVDPAVLVAADELGIHRVLRTNGPAGIAALAFGTETVPQVVKVLGPGSPPVQAAQIEVQRYGATTVMLLGPTESLIIADRSADPALVAADLLSEAEHGADSASVLVTPDEELLADVQRALSILLGRLPAPRQDYARSALGCIGGAVLVDDLVEATHVANLYAPEHLQLATRTADDDLRRVENAGEVLLGQDTPFAAANYTIGVPAALPTGRFARVSSGVTARTFTKATSVARLERRALERMADAIVTLADYEGFPAHAAAIKARVGSGRPQSPQSKEDLS